jgi:hypothetical protein
LPFLLAILPLAEGDLGVDIRSKSDGNRQHEPKRRLSRSSPAQLAGHPENRHRILSTDGFMLGAVLCKVIRVIRFIRSGAS